MLEQKVTLDFTTIVQMAEQLEGSFTITVLDVSRNMYFIKGDNPLALYHFEKEGFYIYASTAAILDCALITLGLVTKFYTEIDAKCGDILRISPDGELSAAKKGNHKMSEKIEFRVSQQKHDQIHASAKKAGVSISEYCRRVLLEDCIIIKVEGLTEIFDAIHKLTDSDVPSDTVNQITAVVTAGIEKVLDKLDSLNIQGGGSSGDMGYKEPSE